MNCLNPCGSILYIYNSKRISPSLSQPFLYFVLLFFFSREPSNTFPLHCKAGALDATCLEPRDYSDPADTIVAAAVGRNATVDSACTINSAHIDNATSPSTIYSIEIMPSTVLSSLVLLSYPDLLAGSTPTPFWPIALRTATSGEDVLAITDQVKTAWKSVQTPTKTVLPTSSRVSGTPPYPKYSFQRVRHTRMA